MDFIMRLSRMPSGNNSIWLIIDRLTKSAHFLLITNTDSLNKLTILYNKDIVRLYEIFKAIVSDRNSRFTSHFLKKSLGGLKNEDVF